MEKGCLIKGSLVLLIIIVFICPSLAGAQPPMDLQQDDLLKEMEKISEEGDQGATPAATPTKPATILSKLVDNFHGSLRLRGMHFWQNPPEREGADNDN